MSLRKVTQKWSSCLCRSDPDNNTTWKQLGNTREGVATDNFVKSNISVMVSRGWILLVSKFYFTSSARETVLSRYQIETSSPSDGFPLNLVQASMLPIGWYLSIFLMLLYHLFINLFILMNLAPSSGWNFNELSSAKTNDNLISFRTQLCVRRVSVLRE